MSFIACRYIGYILFINKQIVMINRIKKDEELMFWRKRKAIIDANWEIVWLEKDEDYISYNYNEKSILKKFWSNVRRIRKDKWLSQEKLARRSRLHRTYISEIERGLKNVSLVNIKKLARALDIKIHVLMNFTTSE